MNTHMCSWWQCLRKVWSEKIAFTRLNIDHAELLPVGPATVVPDNIGFKRAQ
jgi:hypothetical protein